MVQQGAERGSGPRPSSPQTSRSHPAHAPASATQASALLSVSPAPCKPVLNPRRATEQVGQEVFLLSGFPYFLVVVWGLSGNPRVFLELPLGPGGQLATVTVQRQDHLQITSSLLRWACPTSAQPRICLLSWNRSRS